MDLPYQRPRFTPFAVTHPRSGVNLNRAISQAFVCYDQFCERLLRYQQSWTDWVFDHGFAEAIEDVALVFQVAPCLHGPRIGALEVLIPRRTQVFIYMSNNQLQRFVAHQCIAQLGDAVLACMIPPYASDLSLQEMARAHNRFCPGSYTRSADVQCFIAIQLSSRFVEEGTCNVHGRNGLKRTCRSAIAAALPGVPQPRRICFRSSNSRRTALPVMKSKPNSTLSPFPSSVEKS